MKKWNVIFLLTIITFLSFEGLHIIEADNFSNFQGRAISLKVLQQQLKESQARGQIPSNLYNLCGITTLRGYITDEANNDIILIGQVEKGKPSLYLDDFVIALRSAWMKYAELKGNTYYYSNPGCSIDPDPKVMAKLDEVGNQIGKSQSLEQVETVLDRWKTVCDSPQKVRVMGIPYDSHFASVMVKADYDMKKIADGSDELNLLWFSTISDMRMDEAKKQHIHGRSSSTRKGGINRFWFSPGEYRFLESEGAVMIETLKVKLLTEEEHLTSKGDITGTGRTDPVAEKFVNDFSDFYDEVAAQRPIYQELENLFRFVALAKAMKFKAPHEKVGLNLQYLLEQYPVSQQKVETSLPGRSNVSRYKRQWAPQGESGVSHLWLPSCGGVSVDYPRDLGGPDPTPPYARCFFKHLAEDEREKRMSKNNLSWDFGDVSNNKYSSTVILDPSGALNNGHIALLLYSPQEGYYYCSHSGKSEDKTVKKIDSKEEFDRLVKRYGWGYNIEISKSDFEKMKDRAEEIVNSEYKLMTNNCADFVNNVLKAGNKNSKNREVRPNDYICDVMDENEGNVIIKPLNLWK